MAKKSMKAVGCILKMAKVEVPCELDGKLPSLDYCCHENKPCSFMVVVEKPQLDCKQEWKGLVRTLKLKEF